MKLSRGAVFAGLSAAVILMCVVARPDRVVPVATRSASSHEPRDSGPSPGGSAASTGSPVPRLADEPSSTGRPAEPAPATELRVAPVADDQLFDLKLHDAGTYFHVVRTMHHAGDVSTAMSPEELEAEARGRVGDRVLRALARSHPHRSVEDSQDKHATKTEGAGRTD